MSRQQFANKASTTLSAAAGAADTSINLTDASAFPASGNFSLLIDNELLLCTSRASNVLTVKRGQEGTTGVAHSLGATVTQIVTSGSLDRWLRDSLPGAGSGSSRPPFALLDASGNTLSSSDFSVINLSTSTITDLDGGIVLKKPGNALTGENITALARTTPAAPATLIVGLRSNLPRDRTSGFPISLAGFRESSTGKMMFVHCVNNGGPQLQAAKYTNETTQNSIIVTAEDWAFSSDVIWFKAVDDGTVLTLSLGIDGVNFTQVWSEGRTAWFAGGPDQFIWGTNNSGNGYDIFTTLVSWSE